MSDEFWERAAQADPLWAVLSDPQKKDRRWNLRSFLATGEREITLLLHQLRVLGHAPKFGRALDFGCGVGRLTQALGYRFQEVVGVDVAPTMLRIANQLNRLPERVRYVLNKSKSLELFESDSFDFIYSDIVLQHLQPPLARGYIAEFMRVLVPGGIAVFQVPSHRQEPQEQCTRPRYMAADAYRAHIRLIEPAPESLQVGETTTLHAEVTNVSGVSWNQHLTGVMNVGNHWRDPAGAMVVQDDARSALPVALNPGDSARAALNVRVPDTPGDCVCEIDVVHEGISWFGDQGSPVLRITVRITSPTLVPVPGVGPSTEPNSLPDIYEMLPPLPVTDIARFPMFGLPREQVLALLHREGGETFFVEVDERAGPEWQGYRYFVSKPIR
jgi:SAM-dependent methyltransferase